MDASLNIHIAGMLLVLFTVVAGYDGFYLHLVKYRLHARAECRFEHALHTANAVMFPFTILCLFAVDAAGALLWTGLLLTATTFAVEFWDVLTEKKSRAAQGGLTGFESVLHFAMGVLRSGFTAFAVAGKPVHAWRLDAPLRLGRYPAWIEALAWSIVLSGLAAAALHIHLARSGRRASIARR